MESPFFTKYPDLPNFAVFWAKFAQKKRYADEAYRQNNKSDWVAFFFNEKYSVVLSFPSFIDASGNFEVLFQPEKNLWQRGGHLAVPDKKNVAMLLN